MMRREERVMLLFTDISNSHNFRVVGVNGSGLAKKKVCLPFECVQNTVFFKFLPNDLCRKNLRSLFHSTELNVTCRYSGVFHVEKNGRYSISPTEAADLCTAFNSTLPTYHQMEVALEAGFETCR